MTMPQGSAEEPDVILTAKESIPVHVVSSDARPVRQTGTEFGRFHTFIVANTPNQLTAAPGAQRVLNRSLRRREARIFVLASIAAQPVIDGVIFGSREEINSGMAASPGLLGGIIPIGQAFDYKSQAELWVCYPTTNTNTVYVTVVDFQYASDPEAYEADHESHH